MPKLIAAVLATLIISIPCGANATEMRVLITTAMKAAIDDLSPAFEAAAGHRLRITYGPSGALAKLIAAGLVLAAALLPGVYGLERALSDVTRFRNETELAILVVLAAVVYALAVLLLLGRPWLNSLLREVTVAADTKAPPDLEQSDPTDDSAVLPDNEPPPKA